MKNYLIVAILALFAVLLPPRAFAQQSSAVQALEQRFKQLDKNGDGKITTDEVPQSEFFKQRDKNGDGVITLAEAKAALAVETSPPASAIPAKAKTPSSEGKFRSKSSSPAIRQGPRPLQAAQHGVGRLVADLSFTDLSGKSNKLSSFSEQRAIVVAMTSTSCPLSKKYLPTLTSLASTYAQRGVIWILVNPIPADRPEDIQTAARSLDGNCLYVRDRNGVLAKTVGALTTTDVIVLDGARTVLFHGAVDDQYGIGYAVEAPRQQYLADALEAILANKHPLIAATESPGCALDLDDAPVANVAITYHNRISRIVQKNCLECHHEGGVGPFSLATHEDVAGHAGMIKQVIEMGTMPPWFATAPEAAKDSKTPSIWANDRSLAETDKTDLLAWIHGGKQAGNASDAPQPSAFNDGWHIGKPDAVFDFPEAISVKATGVMPYQNVVVETNLGEDKWIQAIEVQPGDRTVVHHMLIYLLAPDRDQISLREEAADESAGFWAIYVPGNATLIYPEGFAKLLPRGVKLRCQVHYATSGTATTDQSRIGVVFAKQPPQHEVRVVGIGNPKLAIPPGAENHREDGSLRLPFDIQILSYLPHMHLRAKACRYRVVNPAGDTRMLLDIPRYDFNWQLLYRYREPLKLAKGETIKFTGWYDNSKNNPANPDPTQTVRWGKQLEDEMHLGYVEYFVPGLQPGEPLPTNPPQR